MTQRVGVGARWLGGSDVRPLGLKVGVVPKSTPTRRGQVGTWKSRPDYGSGFQVQVPRSFQVVLSSLGGGGMAVKALERGVRQLYHPALLILMTRYMACKALQPRVEGTCFFWASEVASYNPKRSPRDVVRSELGTNQPVIWP